MMGPILVKDAFHSLAMQRADNEQHGAQRDEPRNWHVKRE
jgi:hypothetical protein